MIPAHYKSLAERGYGIHLIKHCGELFYFAAPNKEAAIRRFLEWCEESGDPIKESEIDSIEQYPFDQEFTLRSEDKGIRDTVMYPHEWVDLVASLAGNGFLASTVY